MYLSPETILFIREHRNEKGVEIRGKEELRRAVEDYCS